MTDRLRIPRILCPTDFSEFSARSLGKAVALGRSFGSEITVLHVLPPVLPPGEGVPSLPGALSLDSPFYRQAEDELARFVEPFLHEPLVVKTRLRSGVPWREIEAAARDLPADLVVMGTHGRAGFEHLMLGSVTEKVLRSAPCPILTVGRGPKPAAKKDLFSRIVCAADLTEASVPTLDLALSLAEENEARLILLHVLEGRYEPGGPLGEEAALEQERREVEAFARERLRQSVPDEARDWCAIEERVEVGKPYREILRVAALESADLIVMGAHTQGPLHRLVFGSTASHVVREAACPVLVVRTSERPERVAAKETSVSRAGA